MPASTSRTAARRRTIVHSLPLTEEADAGNRTLAERALDHIRSLILRGVIAPGERLRLEELAATLQLSPMPIREAVRRLVQLGLVEHIPHRGARVVPITVEEVIDLYGARLAVEPLAVERAAKRFTDELYQDGLDLLQDLVDAEAAEDNVAMWNAHANFHFLIYRASASAWLLRTIEPMWERAQCYRTGCGPLMLPGRNEEHLGILVACRKKDQAEASRLMHNQLATVGNRMAELLGSSAEPFRLL